ncbi:MAG: tetratricopeptide repeat protein, partial [candidate division Zixibacteria bacterium]|nr:tetratricopeptide repeat protein [candidate division Zixibacteria bacterium]
PPVAIEEIRQDEEYWQYYLDGLKSFGEGDYEQAIEMWERVLEKYPGSEDTRENLRQARSRLENQNE